MTEEIKLAFAHAEFNRQAGKMVAVWFDVTDADLTDTVLLKTLYDSPGTRVVLPYKNGKTFGVRPAIGEVYAGEQDGDTVRFTVNRDNVDRIRDGAFLATCRAREMTARAEYDADRQRRKVRAGNAKPFAAELRALHFAYEDLTPRDRAQFLAYIVEQVTRGK